MSGSESGRTHRENIFYEIHTGLPREGAGGNEHTRRAWEMLGPLTQPRILDIGCGPGVQTIELARLSSGHVIGLDNNPPYIEELQQKIAGAGLEERVEAVEGSMFALPWPEGSFDVIWAEGSIYVIGFERGLREWREWLRPGGYLAVSELSWLRTDPPRELREHWNREYPALTTIAANIALIDAAGYRRIGYFTLPEDAWWDDYYRPLEARLAEMRSRYADDPEALEVIDADQYEIDLYREFSDWYGEVFFVMQHD